MKTRGIFPYAGSNPVPTANKLDMSVIDKNLVLISVAIIFKEQKRGNPKWLIVKEEEEGSWTLPRIIARKTESTARAALRMSGEQLGMSTKVLEEAGRAGGVTTVNDKTAPKRELYYLVRLKAETGEAIGFHKADWFDYAGAVRKLSSKRDRKMIKAARKEYRKWKKKKEEEKEEKK